MITVSEKISASQAKVWDYWTNPEHITKWCFASDDWHAPAAKNDLRVGGKFSTTMAAKDGSMAFDFEGEYLNVKLHERIEYKMSDGRKVIVTFENLPDGVMVTESFDPESENSHDMQKAGWQAILGNFRKYVEKH